MNKIRYIFARIFVHSRLLYKIFGLLSILMIVITVILTVFLGKIIDASKNDEITKTNIMLLQEISDNVDLTFSLMEESMGELLWNSDIISSSVNPTRIDSGRDARIFSLLKTKADNNDLIDNAYLYNVYNEKVYTNGNELLSRNGSDVWNVIDRYTAIDLSENQTTTLSTRNTEAIIDGRLFLCVDLYLRRRYATLIYELNLNNFRSFIEKDDEAGKKIYIYDRQQHEVFSNLYKYENSAYLNDPALFMVSSDDTQRSRNNKYYRVTNENNGWSYITPIPTDVINISYGQILPVLLPIILLIFGVCLVVVFQISGNIYRPIGELVQSVTTTETDHDFVGSFDKTKDDEFVYLQTAFAGAADKYDWARNIIYQYSDHLLRGIIKELINGNTVSDIDDLLDYMRYPLKRDDRYLIVLGQPVTDEEHKTPDFENDIYIISIRNIINGLNSKKLQIIPLYWEKNQILIVASAKATVSVNEIKIYMQRLYNSVDNLTEGRPYRMVWGMGRISNSIIDMRYSYTEALKQLNYQLYYSENGEIEISPPAAGKEDYEYYLEERVKQIWSSGYKGSQADCEELIRHIVNEIRQRETDLHSSKVYFNRVMDVIKEKMVSMQTDDEELKVIQNAVKKIESYEDPDIYWKEAMTVAIDSIRLLYKYSRKTRFTYIEEAKAYIKAHYEDSQITQIDVSEHLGITASYLSDQFKNVTGQTFVSYLNLYRIDRAKQLLRTTDLPIKDIGYRCGFSSAQSFHRVFKQYTDSTPGQYRGMRHENM